MSPINKSYLGIGNIWYKKIETRESFWKECGSENFCPCTVKWKAPGQNRNKTIAIYVKKNYNGCYISGVSAFDENTVKMTDFNSGRDRMVRYK